MTRWRWRCWLGRLGVPHGLRLLWIDATGGGGEDRWCPVCGWRNPDSTPSGVRVVAWSQMPGASPDSPTRTVRRGA